jgi:hypothetical protein
MKEKRFTIGQRVWYFDDNRRVYPRDTTGKRHGSPIYAEHFRECVIAGIEKKSYIINRGPRQCKVSFAKAETSCYSDQTKDDMIWQNSHRHELASLLRSASPDDLRKVAKALGWEPSLSSSSASSALPESPA